MPMISVEEALEKILGFANILEPETKPVLETLGQVLAEDIYSNFDVPPLDNSAMDGYAVRALDTSGAASGSPRLLNVTGTAPAGSVPEFKVTPGTTVRIMTGAALPEGADAVVRFENTDETKRSRDTNQIGILEAAVPGLNVRRAGEDIAKNTLILRRGTVIRPQEVGVLASMGRAEIKVIRRPKVAVLATGNELVNLGQKLPPGKIYNSNSYSVAAGILKYGGIPQILGIALDIEDSLIKKIEQGVDADMLITTGGVSLGDYDLVKDVLAKKGQISFWTVRMKPGKPVAFGTIRGAGRDIPHLGLPGNPVSAMVTSELYLRAAIFKMMGKKQFSRSTIEVILEDEVENNDGRRVFARAVVEKRGANYYARTTGPQGSGILTSMTLANGLVIIPEDVPLGKPGDKVKAIMLDWSGEEF